jgi:hypothetical protein
VLYLDETLELLIMVTNEVQLLAVRGDGRLEERWISWVVSLPKFSN